MNHEPPLLSRFTFHASRSLTVSRFTFHVLGCHPAIRNGLGPWSRGQLSVVARDELRL